MESKFAKSLSNLRSVPTGTKASNDTVPTVTVLGIPNKFHINRLATVMMGLTIKDRVRIFDNKEAESLDERYFIAKTSQDDPASAKLGKANSGNKSETGIDMSFNYSGVWSILVQGKHDAVEMGYDALVASGVVVKGATSSGREKYRAASAIKLEVVYAGTATIDEIEYEVYALTNYKATRKSDEELASELAAAAKKEADAAGSDDDDEEDLDLDLESDTDETEETEE